MSAPLCEMCGKGQRAANRWYKYDNGDQYLATVCRACADLHDKLVTK